jgi:hypothetical protein
VSFGNSIQRTPTRGDTRGNGEDPTATHATARNEPSASGSVIDLSNEQEQDVLAEEDEDVSATVFAAPRTVSGPALDSVTFDDNDPRYITYTRHVEPKKGGAPPNQAYRRLLILCHPIGIPDKNRSLLQRRSSSLNSKRIGPEMSHSTTSRQRRHPPIIGGG